MDYNFFAKFNIDPLSFDRSGLQWQDLEKIGEDYQSHYTTLLDTANLIASDLFSCPSIHSVNYRIKDRDHLMEKIIRKSLSSRETRFSENNYRSLITDLIGVRVLHLYRDDWTQIHSFLKDKWTFAEQPIAYIRQGDPDRLSRYYKELECEVREHPHGYRSVHYVLCKDTHQLLCPVEIQTRTLFEEAWGEIDHSVRYPYYADNEVLGRLSGILNRLAADADDLGTYMRFLKERTIAQEEEHQRELQEKNRVIDFLRSQINALSIDSRDKQLLDKELGSLRNAPKKEQTPLADLPWLDSLVESNIFKHISGKVEGFLRKSKEDPIPVSMDDLDIMKNAQKGLMDLLKNPEQLKRIIGEPFTSQEEQKEQEEDGHH
ncbi:MAG: hypothetical protein JXB03_03065 [Spirochaetales bacterium]|nr:hypothetical protein [Spirochaetales bacterium]